jgi:transposase InsO family protein
MRYAGFFHRTAAAGSWRPARPSPWISSSIPLDPPHRAAGRSRGRDFVGSVGDSYVNALAETIIGLYKTEVIHQRGPWRHIDAVEYATLEWVDWFNHRRLLEPIGNVPAAELESACDRQQQALAMAA